MLILNRKNLAPEPWNQDLSPEINMGAEEDAKEEFEWHRQGQVLGDTAS